MKRILITTHFIIGLLLAGLFISPIVSAQSFRQALEQYESESYEEALEILSSLRDEDRVSLLRGKSHLALGNYMAAVSHLERAAESDNEEIVNEARYTVAVSSFRSKNFTRALELLHSLQNAGRPAGLRDDVRSLYRELLSHLTEKQQYELFMQTQNPAVRMDLLRSVTDRGAGYMADAMWQLIQQDSGQYSTSDLRTLRQRIEQVPSSSGTSGPYPVPDGMVYHIGVALPAGGPDDPGASVARDLYSGLVIAAEEFNARHNDRKVFLHFENTEADPNETERILHRLLWLHHADLIIGPLFSESAQTASKIAERYQIPVVTPLANSDNINEGNHYLFQINPTFALHGIRMARFAVQDQGLRTLAVITQPDALGRASALAFRSEAERLGAHVAHMIEGDFAAAGYDLSEFTDVLNPDPEVRDSLGLPVIDGIYAPFTGQESETLINQLMTDLEWMNSRAAVMGSEEWGSLRLTDEQQRSFPIWYTQSFSETVDRERIAHFREDFVNRFGRDPDRFARIGYDTGQFLLGALEEAGNPAVLNRALRNAPLYRGLAMNIHFDGWQSNRHVQIVPANTRAQQVGGQDPPSR